MSNKNKEVAKSFAEVFKNFTKITSTAKKKNQMIKEIRGK